MHTNANGNFDYLKKCTAFKHTVVKSLFWAKIENTNKKVNSWSIQWCPAMPTDTFTEIYDTFK